MLKTNLFLRSLIATAYLSTSILNCNGVPQEIQLNPSVNGSEPLFKSVNTVEKELGVPTKGPVEIIETVTPTPLENKPFLVLAAAIVSLQIATLYAYGQPALPNEPLQLWDGGLHCPGTSQHLTDYYTFSHIIHGFAFYGITSLLVPTWSVKSRFLISLGTEGAWEMIENSELVIERYREQALSEGYNGDTIVNSFCDTLAMAVGFIMTHYLPTWAIVGSALASELITGYLIRDNLTLNIIMLIYPFDFITEWQKGRPKDWSWGRITE